MSGSAIAVIGMAGRFPGANDVDALWDNLIKGVESVDRIDLEKWAEEVGAHPAFLESPDLVRARPRIEGVELFDASFFGYSPREAQILDPQQRLFLECTWEALENAGYDSDRYDGSIGVAAGVSQSSYLMNYVQWDKELNQLMGPLKIGLGNMNDALATRIAYKLNLKGASYAVQSFCSTSLVAVHLGCQSLLNHETDMMLAGGVTISVSQNVGYRYQEGGILSADGHTRTFDARARGMVFGNGLGAVVLKRLSDALRDGDNVRAVILGSAVNNDGSVKVGYTAPSVGGQAEVVVEALSAAGVDPETIGYVEAHGTATALGDPAEIAGLTRAWRKWTNKKKFCAIGSVKTNIGHLDAAAGVAGLIKTVLSLEHARIPKSLHFESPNPEIDFENSPFFVASEHAEWRANGGPRRAGLSSFGIGGTNAHAVLEEAPPQTATDPARPWQLLVLSAKTESAAQKAVARLAAHVERQPETNLADTAWTLAVGRRVFNHRRFVVARDADDLRAALDDFARIEGGPADRQGAPVAFMFTGQGSQYVGMGRGLYDGERAYREAFDRCAETLRDPLDLDLRELVFAPEDRREEATDRLRQTALTQPALFAVEYALAMLWMSWGIQPTALIGHSVGEYVAACLAGVFSLEDALGVVAERGRLMQSMPPGAMLAVPLSEDAVRPSPGGGVDLASLNAPSASVVSGPEEAIARLEGELAAQGVMARRLRTSHAFHSAMMEPILAPFEERVAAVERRAPEIPFVSNLSGTWITEAEATDPAYWARHLRGAVRFFDGVRRLRAEGNPILLEVGPGNTLATLARQHSDDVAPASTVVHSLRHPREEREDRAVLLGALGRLWVAGGAVDWSGVHAGETRRRLPLPTYPFERERFWVDPSEEEREAAAINRGYSLKRMEVGDWFYQMSWRRLMPPEIIARPAFPEGGTRWLLFLDETGLGEAIAAELREAGQAVTAVRPGRHFGGDAAEGFVLSPRERGDYLALAKALADRGQAPTHVVHLFGVDRDEGTEPLEERLADAQGRGFYSLLFLAQALVKADVQGKVEIAVVTTSMQDVTGGDLTRPEKATVLGPCRVIPQEHQNLRCRSIDLDAPPSDPEALSVAARRIIAEALARPRDAVVAYRGGHRWVQSAEPVSLPAAPTGLPLVKGGVYLITGGQGGIGLSLARYLAEQWQAKLVLTGRSREPRQEVLAELEARGAEVLYVPADSASRAEMEAALARTHELLGPVKGVIHSAGVAGGGIIQLKEPDAAARVMAPKLEGTATLASVLRSEPLDFFVLCSSTAALLGGFGQVDYCAANCFLDAFSSHARSLGLPVQSINWDAWREVGMAVNTPVTGTLALVRDWNLKLGISPAEGVDAFCRALGSGMSPLAVFTMDLWPALLKQRGRKAAAEDEDEGSRDAVVAPAVEDDAEHQGVAAGEIERLVIGSWEKVLGRKGIGLDDNFFELGGDSLTAIQAASLLKAHLDREVAIVTFYDAPTVSLLARALGQEQQAKQEPANLGEVEQRAETRLDLMRRRRQRLQGSPDETRPTS